MGALFGFLMLATALITFFTVKEPGVPQEESLLGFFETYKRVFQNKPYVLILSVYTLHVTAITLVSGIHISVILAKRMGKKGCMGWGCLYFPSSS